MNMNHNTNALQYMTEDEYDDDPSFSVSKISRKEIRSKKENEKGENVHDISNGKKYRKY